jgi:hypothetical protein
MKLERASFSPEDVTLMKGVLAAARLPLEKCTSSEKLVLAQRILNSAAAGQRDPVRLLAAAEEM